MNLKEHEYDNLKYKYKYDEQFWNELYSFLQKHSNEEYILIGDFNTINNRNVEEFRKILYNAYDIWHQKQRTFIMYGGLCYSIKFHIRR